MSHAGATISENHVVFLRYVAHGQMLAFLAKGWVIDDELHGTNHGIFSILMRWEGEHEPD